MAREREITFSGGGVILRGVLHEPLHSASWCIVISHGFAGYGGSPKWNFIARGLARAGFPVFRFSHRGCGDSGGDFADTTLTTRIAELNAAMDAMSEETGARTFGLIGGSMGGATVLMCASQPRVRCSFTLAAPSDFSFFSSLASAVNPENGNIIVDGAEVKPGLIDDANSYDILSAAASAKNLFIMHGESDMLIPTGHASRIHERAPRPSGLMIVPEADHSFSEERHQQIMLDQCLVWFRRCLDVCPAPPAETADDQSE